jgi:hypothetical protein
MLVEPMGTKLLEYRVNITDKVLVKQEENVSDIYKVLQYVYREGVWRGIMCRTCFIHPSPMFSNQSTCRVARSGKKLSVGCPKDSRRNE